MTHICLIPGDGIGQEVMAAARQVLSAIPIDWQLTEAAAGWQTFQQLGTALPDATRDVALAADVVLFGAVASPSHPVEGYRSPIVALRRALDLYANIRPTTNDGIHPAHNQQSAVDMVVVRENTEGLYAGRERLEDDGATAIAERVITRHGTERIIRKACELALERAKTTHHTPRVTLVHKANVLRVTDGLFREVALGVMQSPEFAGITHDELLVDTAAMHIAQNPQRFDVIVTTNLFGDILSDVACIHGGGLGLASSANVGQTYALFEPVHGAAPDIAGKNQANPLAMLRCVALMLAWLAQREATSTTEREQLLAWATRLQHAITTTLRDGPHTPDMGGTATTHDITNACIAHITS